MSSLRQRVRNARKGSPCWSCSSSLCSWGLVTALAVPNLERLRTAVTAKTERDYILDQFAGLGRQAMLQGRAYVVFGTGGAQGAGLAEPARETADAAPEEPRARPCRRFVRSDVPCGS